MWGGRCLLSSCRPAPGSTTPTGSRARSRTSCAACRRCARRSSSAARSSAARSRAAQGDIRHQLRQQIRTPGDAEGASAAGSARSSPTEPDIRYWFLKDNGQRDLQLIIAGPDIDVINDTANQIASEMRSIPIIENPMSTAELDRPELRIAPKRQVAADLGVSTEALSETIRVATLGDIDANLAKFNAGDRLVPIRVELDEAARSRIGLSAGSEVPTAGGATTPLSVVADFSIEPRPDRDQPLRPHAARDDRSRSRRRRARSARRSTAIHALPTAKNLPPGVEIRETGDVEVMSEVFASFAAAMGAGLMMVYGAARAAVRQLPAADHHPVLAAAVDRRRDRRAAHHPQGDLDAGGDRHSDADGHRHQERDHAGRLRC